LLLRKEADLRPRIIVFFGVYFEYENNYEEGKKMDTGRVAPARRPLLIAILSFALTIYCAGIPSLLAYTTGLATSVYSNTIITQLGSRPTVESSYATSIPTIDGTISAAEWQDATFVDITSDSMEASAYFKNDASFLYVAVDAPFAGEYGWQQGVPFDRIRIDFDAGNDQSLFSDRYFEFGVFRRICG